VEGGKVRTQRLKKELITMAQLEAAARKQGFESLSEVDQCVLEPVARLLCGKKPATEDVRHQELLAKLEHLTQEIPSCGARSLLHALDSVQKETCRCQRDSRSSNEHAADPEEFFLVSSVIEQSPAQFPKALLAIESVSLANR